MEMANLCPASNRQATGAFNRPAVALRAASRATCKTRRSVAGHVATSSATTASLADVGCNRRGLLAGTAGAALIAAEMLLMSPGPSSAATAAAAGLTADVTAAVTAVGIPRTTVAEGLSLSRVIKGCWQLSGGHRGDSATDRTSGMPAVQDFASFYNAGITSWDCADHYGPAEQLIGRYLSEHPEQTSNVQVLTKLCVFTGAEMSGMNKGYVSRAVDLSRSRLGLPTIDLMQFYWGDNSQPKYTDAMLYLSEMVGEGRIRHLGTTNFDVPRLQKIADSGVKMATNQLSYSLLDTRPENGTSAFCAANGISLLPYGVLAGGFLSEKYLDLPISNIKMDTSSKGKYGRVIVERGGWDWFQSLLKVLNGIAVKHGSTISNVATRWVLDRPGVAGVILGARNATHVPDHVALFGLSLDEEDRGRIDEVLAKGKRPRGDCYAWERGEGVF